MKLSETGEARVRGYLFVLGRSLRSSLPRDVAADALREIESHIRERLDEAADMPNESAAVERVLQQLGAPLRVARAYSTEAVVEEAVVSGRLVPTLRALWLLATGTIGGFFAALFAFVGYAFGVGFLVVAVMTLVDPARVGLVSVGGVPHALGIIDPLPAGATVHGGLDVAIGCALAGIVVLLLTHRGARRLLGYFRRRLAAVRGSEADEA